MPDKRKEGGASSSTLGSEKSLGGSTAKKAKMVASTTVPVDEGGQTSMESLTYDPVHFIRSHSKNNDPADIQTQVTKMYLGENFFVTFSNPNVNLHIYIDTI